VVKNLDKYLDEENCSGICIQKEIRVILKGMLALNPEKRMSPEEILNKLEE
jgi:hypothetical protein